MLDHVGFPVSDYARSKAFYSAALAPLGCRLIMEITDAQTRGHGDHAGFGSDGPDFWIGTGRTAASATHVAFRAPGREAVGAFHEAALAAGGHDNGPPGLRPHYHANYYAAFIIDPDGNNIEAVCHDPG